MPVTHEYPECKCQTCQETHIRELEQEREEVRDESLDVAPRSNLDEVSPASSADEEADTRSTGEEVADDTTTPEGPIKIPPEWRDETDEMLRGDLEELAELVKSDLKSDAPSDAAMRFNTAAKDCSDAEYAITNHADHIKANADAIERLQQQIAGLDNFIRNVYRARNRDVKQILKLQQQIDAESTARMDLQLHVDTLRDELKAICDNSHEERLKEVESRVNELVVKHVDAQAGANNRIVGAEADISVLKERLTAIEARLAGEDEGAASIAPDGDSDGAESGEGEHICQQ